MAMEMGNGNGVSRHGNSTLKSGLGDSGASGQAPVAPGKEGQRVNTVPEMESSR